MAFSRVFLPPVASETVDRTADMVAVGLNFAPVALVAKVGAKAAASGNPNIEDTLVNASFDGVDGDDLRVLSVLTTWFNVHSACINIDRLARVIAKTGSARVKAYWASLAMHAKDRRFHKMTELYNGPRLDLLRVGTEFQIGRHGEDPRFLGAPLRVPSNALRDRRADVLEPAQVAVIHRAYYWRMIIGPTYRADMWAALEDNFTLSVSDLARKAYGSFATAWRTKKDWSIVHAAGLRR